MRESPFWRGSDGINFHIGTWARNLMFNGFRCATSPKAMTPFNSFALFCHDPVWSVRSHPPIRDVSIQQPKTLPRPSNTRTRQRRRLLRSIAGCKRGSRHGFVTKIFRLFPAFGLTIRSWASNQLWIAVLFCVDKVGRRQHKVFVPARCLDQLKKRAPCLALKRISSISHGEEPSR